MTATGDRGRRRGTEGGAARFRVELDRYLEPAPGAQDIKVIGAARSVDPAWLLRREMTGRRGPAGGAQQRQLRHARRRAVDTAAQCPALPDRQRDGPAWTRTLRGQPRARRLVVRLAARRSDVLVAPSTAMAERVTRILPRPRGPAGRAGLHPVSADAIPRASARTCHPVPGAVLPYKQMADRLTELLAALGSGGDPSVTDARHRRTQRGARAPRWPSADRAGRAPGSATTCASCGRAAGPSTFRPGIESFGYPLAEARVNGQPVIARDTPQNREIARPGPVRIHPR